jgi:hypothetical protein
MVVGHLVTRFERGESEHKDLIISYAQHERELQVRPLFETNDSTHRIRPATFISAD